MSAVPFVSSQCTQPAAPGSRRLEEPTEFRSYVLSVMPSLCGVITPLAGIVSEYVEGEKFPVYPHLPEDYQSTGETIIQACRAGNLNQVRYLVEVTNVDPDARNREEFLFSRPIITAAAFNQLSCVQYLLFRGVSPFTESNQGMTALQVAARCGRQMVADYFLTFFNSPAIAAQYHPASADQPNSSAPARRLCDVPDSQGFTVLHAAASGGCGPLVERLIRECGADCNNTSNVFQETPLHAAAGWGKKEVVQLLVEEFNLDIRTKNRDGLTAAEVAMNEGYVEVAQYLKTKET